MAQVVPSLTSLPLDSTVAPTSEDIQNRLPSICVDYLSHDWAEEDVWASWRNMTRHKNEIANGVRLENASWRTWWKQRNKLRTISPETLNWLKDSDVTWLYGPLHTAVEPVPPPKISSTDDRLGIVRSSTNHPTRPVVSTKPILKHRTLSELLSIPNMTTPSSPILEGVNYGLGEEGDGFGEGMDGEGEGGEAGGGGRPTLMHTKSDTNIVRKTQRNGSPPRGAGIGGGGQQQQRGSHIEFQEEKEESMEPILTTQPTSAFPGTKRTNTQSSSTHHHAQAAKRHISFNTFVEQCIAVDDPADIPEIESATQRAEDHNKAAAAAAAMEEERGMRMDEDEYEEDDDDDDMLEMRAGSSSSSRASSSSRSSRSIGGISSSTNTNSSNNNNNSNNMTSGLGVRPVWSRNSSSSSSADHMTIAKIAPTTLKTLGNFPAHSPYGYNSHPGGSGGSSPSSETYAAEHGEDDQTGITYKHMPSVAYRDVNNAGYNYNHAVVNPNNTQGRQQQQQQQQQQAFDFPSPQSGQDLVSSPSPWGQQTEEDEYESGAGFDYFSGPDFGVGDEYNTKAGGRGGAGYPAGGGGGGGSGGRGGQNQPGSYGARNSGGGSGNGTPKSGNTTPQVGQAPQQPKWRTGNGAAPAVASPAIYGSNTSTARPSPSGSQILLPSDSTSPPMSSPIVTGGRGILKIRPPGYNPPQVESTSPTSSYFNFNPSAATGFGGMGHGTQRLPREPLQGSLPLYDAHNSVVLGGTAGPSTPPQVAAAAGFSSTPTSPSNPTGDFERGRAAVRTPSVAERSMSRGTSNHSTSLSPNAARAPVSIPASGSGTAGLAAVSTTASLRQVQQRPTSIDTTTPFGSVGVVKTPGTPPSQHSSGGSTSPNFPFPSSPLAGNQRTKPMEEMKVDGETSHQENVEVEDDRMDVDQPGSMTTTEEEKKVDPYVPERTGTPTPHSSPQIAFRPLLDTSPASLPHASGHLASTSTPDGRPTTAMGELATPSTSSTSSTASLKRHHSRSPSLPSLVTGGAGGSGRGGGGESALRRISAGNHPQGGPQSGAEDEEDGEGGTIIGRAVNIANTAKDLFGALWSYGGQQQQGGGGDRSGAGGGGGASAKE